MPIDSTPTPPAPKAKRTPAARPAPAMGVREAREAGLKGFAQIGTMICVSRGLWADAATIKDHGPGLARETAALGDQYEEVGKAIDFLVSAGPFTAIIGVALPFVLQIAANHGRIDVEKAGIGGIEDPRDLEARMIAETERTKLLIKLARQQERQEIDAMIAQLEADANKGQNPE